MPTVESSPNAFLVNGEVFFDPHPGKQLALVQRCAARVVRGEGASKKFARGNRGGGKSFAARRGVCHALALACPGLKYIVVRRNMPDLRQNHLVYVGKEMRTLGGEFHGTHSIAYYPNGSMGFYRQCEDEADVEKIVGSEAAVVFVDEAPQIRWEHLRMISPSLRVPEGPDGRKPYYTLELYGGNPIGESIEELDKYFVDKDVDPVDDPTYDPRDWELIEIGLGDNPSLDPDEYRRQFAGLPEHYRRAWVDGVRMDARTLFEVQRTVTERLCTHQGDQPRDEPWDLGLVGRPYHVIDEMPTVQGRPLLETPGVTIYRAFDMGFFPDPAVCLWLAVYGKRVIAFHEETWFKTVASDLAARILETTRELVGSDVPVAMTCVDPDIGTRRGVDVTVMDTLEMAGVPCEPSINDRVLYADAIHGLLGETLEPGVPKFQIYAPGCPLLLKYLPKMQWDEKNPRKMADHKFDHWPVALAYFAISSGVLGSPGQVQEKARPVWLDWIAEGRGRRQRIH